MLESHRFTHQQPQLHPEVFSCLKIPPIPLDNDPFPII